MSQTLPTIAEGTQYGHSIVWALKVEGIATLFVETADHATWGTAPTNYTMDGSLIVDASSKIGWVMDRKTGIAMAYDLKISLLQTDAVEGLFKAPTKHMRLSIDHDHTAVDFSVESNVGWSTADFIYLGNERLDLTVIGGSPFTAVTVNARGTWAKARKYKAEEMASATATDTPWAWRGRRVDLYACHMDPFGLNHAANVLTDSAKVWTGFIDTHPIPEGGLWTFNCRAMDRLLTRETIAVASGKGQWRREDDPLVAVDPDFTWQITFGDNALNQDVLTLQPFAGLSGNKYASELRQLIETDWNANVVGNLTNTVPTVGNLVWVDTGITGGEGDQSWWQATTIFTGTAANQTVQMLGEIMDGKMASFSAGGLSNPLGLPGGPSANLDGTGSDETTVSVPLLQLVGLAAGSLRVVIDNTDPTDLPTSGFLIMEIGGAKEWVQYDDLVVDQGEVTVLFDPQNMPQLRLITSNLQGGDLQDFSVTFGFLDANQSPKDFARRWLMSSGRGTNNATYDVLAQEIGYDVKDVDTASFDTVLSDVLWDSLQSVDWTFDKEATFAKTLGGLFFLGQVGIVSRPDDDAGEVLLTMVDTAVADTSPPVFTITDGDIATSGAGRKAVRAKRQLVSPNIIEASISRTEIVGETSIIARDTAQMKLHGPKSQKVSLHSVERADALGVVTDWARAHFTLGGTAQVIEVDINPGLASGTSATGIRIGDMGKLTSNHPSLRNLSTGRMGYDGRCRVLGWQMSPKSYLVTLTLLIDGNRKGVALCPSAVVQDWTGSPTQPTAPTDELFVPAKYFAVMSEYFDTASEGTDPAVMIVYDPSSDTAATSVDIGGVRLDGVYCKLLIDSLTGAPTFTADETFLTPPLSAADNTAQANYMHSADAEFFI